jgi:hypothetical protein
VEVHDTLENKGNRVPDAESKSFALSTTHDPSERLASAPKSVSDEELERAIVEAVMQGLGDVARALAARLEARRRR